MKKLISILLVVMLCLGLSGIANAATTGDQTISVKILTSIAISIPGDITDNSIVASGDWTDDTEKVVIDTNCPYNVQVKVSATALPSGETTPDAYMTAITSPFTDLGSKLNLGYHSTGGTATSTDETMTYPAAITTGDVIFVSCPSDPEDGSDDLGVKFKQTTTLADPSYHTSGSLLEYKIKLTWTASIDVGL